MCNKNYEWQITAVGIVQGVGFRPFVKRAADLCGVCGYVCNCGGLVEVVAAGDVSNLENFLQELKKYKKYIPKAQVFNFSVKKAVQASKIYNGFEVKQSQTENNFKLIPPDIALCDECRAELCNKTNRRYGYWFNTCTQCGPRYSIINALPYDRQSTTMHEFELCQQCADEYDDKQNRRYIAETVSCKSCGPKLFFAQADGSENILEGDNAFNSAVKIINNGGVVLVKGIGGYHIACSAFNANAAKKIRLIKKRDKKPFAVMFKNIDNVKQLCNVNKEEQTALKSQQAPIVLLKMNSSGVSTIPKEVVCNSTRCGAFLPYAPLQELLLEQTGSLVLTSANFCDSPIIFEDEQAQNFAAENADYIDGVLYTNRKIEGPCDDSVLQIVLGKQQLIRRARGFAPLPVAQICGEFFAAGSDLKSAFCLCKNGYAYLSPYIGDLTDYNTFERYAECKTTLCNLLDVTPKAYVADKHPSYLSSEFAAKAAQQNNTEPPFFVQHHIAHIASVICEHSLANTPVIGAAFDGVGYGDDGTVWGGEFFAFAQNEITHTAHLEYSPILANDASSKNAKLAAAFMCQNYGIDLGENFNEENKIVCAAKKGGLTVASSSIGRLFDAVCALLGLCDYNSYEGECAVLLQQFAEAALQKTIAPAEDLFTINTEGEELIFSPQKLLQCCANAKTANRKYALALGLHSCLAQTVAQICSLIRQKQATKNGVESSAVALSGGVFQNCLLTTLAEKELKNAGFAVYINEQTPPNDGGIALGQAYIYSKFYNKN
ncbi:MAG: carbamoyltransferase HypF [Oscillospiraceae bacterium]|jgi:hydrogenase maturation protein HypF|nr:carbamoyltransferase HypF [Oscillospiraceae bacterium]